MDCQIQNIRLITVHHEAYTVNPDGTKNELVLTGPPYGYDVSPLEFCCVEHNCSFKQWRAVLSHIGEN